VHYLGIFIIEIHKRHDITSIDFATTFNKELYTNTMINVVFFFLSPAPSSTTAMPLPLYLRTPNSLTAVL